MQLFKRIMSMEPSPVAETISLAELVTAYAGYVKELSLSCQLYEASTAAGSSSAVPQVWLQGMPPQDKIEDTMCRCVQGQCTGLHSSYIQLQLHLRGAMAQCAQFAPWLACPAAACCMI
jgi:hypothetical protein